MIQLNVGRILIRPIKAEPENQFLAHAMDEKIMAGEVVAVGPLEVKHLSDHGTVYSSVQYSEGDLVRIPSGYGTEDFTMDGEELLLMRQEDVQGRIIKKEEK